MGGLGGSGFKDPGSRTPSVSPCGWHKLELCQGKCILLVACKAPGNESFCCTVMEMEKLGGKWGAKVEIEKRKFSHGVGVKWAK